MKITNKKSRKLPIILAILLLAIIIIAAGLFYIYKRDAKQPNENFTSTQESGGGITSGKETDKSSSDQPTPPDSNITPATPTGTFVSNHRPNLSGNPAPNNISSVCTTTPGSECTITFTKDGTTKTLSKKVADANGNTSWDWKLQDIGLTIGEWQITAIASNGNNIVKASDSMPLIVGE